MGSRRTQSSARHIVSSCRPDPPPFAVRRGPKSRSQRGSRSGFPRSNAGRFSSPHGHEMGHHRASGRLAIRAKLISTSAAGRLFLAGRIAPSTAPARTCPEREANLKRPEFSANVTPVTSARTARREDQYIYFWRTASGTSAARRAVLSGPPPICRNSIWLYTFGVKPYQGPKILSPGHRSTDPAAFSIRPHGVYTCPRDDAEGDDEAARRENSTA